MHTAEANPAEHLSEEYKAASQLIALLKREQIHLIEATIEGLPELTEEKAQVVSQMMQLASARYKKLASAGFAPSEQGMQDWLKSPAVKSDAKKVWDELISFAKSAKELNRTNGLLINKHMTRNQLALNVLNVNVHGGSFYGPDGQSTGKTTSRNLVIG